ncbi:MAG: hypothetical protein PHD86_07530 [Kiritimatiellae bacterium]|nr:hypothetical protein [Kiritimatiellia bacterium]
MARVVRFLRYEAAREDQRPSVLFLGSSRFQSCIVPEVFEKQARQWGGDVRFINASHPAMEYWEFLRILPYVNMADINAGVCVIELNPFTFNRQLKHTVTKELQYYRREYPIWGRFRDLRTAVGVSAKTRLFWSLILPRRTFRDWSVSTRGIAGRLPEAELLPRAEYQYDMKLEEKQRNDPDFKPHNIARCHMYNYTFSEKKKDDFEQFLGELERRNLDIVLVQPPVSDRYFDYIRESEKRSAEYDRHLVYLEELSGRYRTLFWQTPADAGLDESIFVDYGHFTRDGARVFSGIMAAAMEDAVRRVRPSAAIGQASLRAGALGTVK